MSDQTQISYIENIIQTLERGGLIIVPTETVYGIIGDATKNEAIEKIYNAKNRSNQKPLQIFVRSLEEAKKLAYFGANAESLAQKNWAGALTMVLKKRNDVEIASNFNSIDNTVGIRVPNHDLIQQILSKYNKPLAATSANISGGSDSIDENDVEEALIEKADLFIKGKKTKIGVSSTVVDYTDDSNPKILRQGSVKL